MKRKYTILLITCCWCMILANPGTQAKDAVSATFTFGKIEVLKTGEREWSFLEKGTVLNDNDLVRMPPFSLIRLKDRGEILLPTLPGGRELTISELIVEGRQRRNEAKGRRVNTPFDSRPAIDVLPLGNKSKGDNLSKTTAPLHPTPLMTSELESLRRELDSLPGEIESLISRRLLQNNRAKEESYPSVNLSRALTLYYDTLPNIEAKTKITTNRTLLYAQLLRRVAIDADLLADAKGELFVIFDSGVPIDGSKQIAANQQLIHKKPGADTVWISVQISPIRQNFTTAWYTAGRKLEGGL